jgi:hypothetical protein
MAMDLTGGLPVERELVLAERPAEPDIRDAVNVWLEEAGGAFGMRIGVEAVASEWDGHLVWLDIAFADGRVISLRGDFPVHPALDPDGRPTIRGAGPLRFRCAEPFRRWTAAFKGEAPEISAMDLIADRMPEPPRMRDVEFQIEMTMAVPPWVPGSMLETARAALGQGGQGDFMSPRYEQLFRARGELRVGDERWRFTGQGLRIRRQGLRKFEGFGGHCWQSAVFPSGRAFGFNIYPPRDDGAPSYAEGYVFDGDGALQPARPVEVPWLRRLLPSGDELETVLETAAGPVTIRGVSFANTRSRGHKVLPADFPIVQQAHVRYRWDGEEATGMMERSSPPSRMEL